MEQPISELIKKSFLIKHNEEIPYVLTKEEEEEHIRREVENLKEHFRWRRRSSWGVSLSEFSLENKRRMLDEEVDSINWIERINRDELLGNRNKLKYWAQEEQQRKKEKELETQKIKDELRKKYTSKYVYDLLCANSLGMGKEFQYNKDNSNYIKALCYFLSNDARFDTQLNFSFKKGLLIRGDYGVGKTHAIKCLSQNELTPIRIFSMIDIAREVEREGTFPIYQIADTIVCLDDVGTEEPVVNHYGTKINWFKSFIEGYYAQFNTYESLIVTTNCSFQEIELKYGGRVRSRMAEMFNVIDVEGEDFRKKSK